MLRYGRIIIQIVIIVILILTNCIVSMIIPSEYTVVYPAGEETVLLFHNVFIKSILCSMLYERKTTSLFHDVCIGICECGLFIKRENRL